MKTVTLYRLAQLIIAAKEGELNLEDPAILEGVLKKAFEGVTGVELCHAEPTVPVARPANDPLSTQIGGNHYKQDKIQHVEFAHANNLPYIEANAMKYIMRHRRKNGVQDIDKAIHFLHILRSLEYKDAPAFVLPPG